MRPKTGYSESCAVHCMKKLRSHFHVRCQGKINPELGLDIWNGFWVVFLCILASPIILLLAPLAFIIKLIKCIKLIAPKMKNEIRILVTRLVLTIWNIFIWNQVLPPISCLVISWSVVTSCQLFDLAGQLLCLT